MHAVRYKADQFLSLLNSGHGKLFLHVTLVLKSFVSVSVPSYLNFSTPDW